MHTKISDGVAAPRDLMAPVVGRELHLHGNWRRSKPSPSSGGGCIHTATGPRHPRRSRDFLHRLLILLMAGIAGFGRAEADGTPFLPVLQTRRQGPERDPFRGPEAASEAPRPAGLAGLGVTETTVRGIVRSRVPGAGGDGADSAAWAILESPSGEGFVAAPGDGLFDGVLGLIEDGGVVFWLDGDPERRVYRPLGRPATDAGECT